MKKNEESTAVMTATKQQTGFVRKRIGNTVYAVSIYFNNKSKENMDDKILRLAKYDAEDIKEATAE